MRQSSKPFIDLGAIARPLFAVAAGLALLLASAPARAGETVIWKPTGSSGAWDTTTANWTAGGNDVRFVNGDAVVFGLDANGNRTNQNATITIDNSGFNVGPQAYAGIGSGTNPGMIIGSGSWFFVGGTISGGTMLITGSAAYQFTNAIFNEATGLGGGRLYITDQRIEVVDNADFKYSTSINQTLEFRGTNAYTGDGGSMHTGTNSNLTLNATYGGIFFYSQSASERGGAVYTGGDLNIQQTTTGTLNWFNVLFDHNSSGQQGGAIYSAGDVNMTISSGTSAFLTPTFTGNKSGAEGGAIYAGGNVTVSGSSVFSANSAASHGGAIYAKGDVILSGISTFTGNTAAQQAGAIYSGGNVTISGTGASAYFTKNTSADGISSEIYAAGTLSLTNGAKIEGDGGFAAQEFYFSNGTLAPNEIDTKGILTLTTIDASGSAVAAPGKIKFDNMTIYAHYGELAVNEGSNITIGGILTLETSASSVGVRDTVRPTIISADLVGDGEILKTGSASILLTGTNTYTGPTTVNSGTLIGNIADNTVLTIEAGGAYAAGSGTSFAAVDRNLAELNGAGLINMGGAALRVAAGDFSSGTVANITTLAKTGADTLILGNGTIATLDITEGKLNVGSNKQLTVTGTTIVPAGSSLGVNVSDAPALKTNTLDTQAGSTIDITGYGTITAFSTTGTHTLVVSNSTIDHNSYTLTLNGAPLTSGPDLSQFLSFTQLTSSATTITVASTLVWNSTAPGSAHGTFNVNTGVFSLDTALAENTDTAAYFGGWDGNSLVKTGYGTLVLNGTNTYTGTTTVAAGLLYNTNLVSGPVAIHSGAFMVNTGSIKGDIDNAGYFEFQSKVIDTGTAIIASSGTYLVNATGTYIITNTTTPYTGEIDADTITGTTTWPIFGNGHMGNINNTGTVGLAINTDYTYTGTLAGTGGAIIKTGTATITLAGASTHTGSVEIQSGAIAASKAHILDSASSYNLSTAAATLDFGGYDQNLKDVVNYGTIRFGPASGTAYVTATFANYSGTGALAIRSDYSTGKADTLRITGTATGEHRILITNVDTATASKSQDSIPVIYVSSDTALANATFSGTAESGIGILTIHRGEEGSLLSPDPNIWYLAATDKLSNTADAILATISVSGLEWLYALDSVRQRMGDLRQEALMAPPERKQSPLAYTTVTSAGGNTWVRGNVYHLDAQNDITGVPFKEDVFNINLGYDKTYRWEDNQYLLGLDVGISNVDRTFLNTGPRTISGEGKTDSYGFGLYFSYLKDNGWYGDTTFRITRNNNSLDATAIDSFTNSADYKHTAWGFSIEVGKIVKSKKTGWWYEPSGQAAIANIGGKTFASSNDIEVAISNSTIMQYRFSLRAGRDAAGSRFKPYIKAAAVSVQTSGGRVRVANQYFAPDMDGFRAEAGAGMAYTFNEKSQLYIDYEYSKASSYERPWSFNLGFRHTW